MFGLNSSRRQTRKTAEKSRQKDAEGGDGNRFGAAELGEIEGTGVGNDDEAVHSGACFPNFARVIGLG